jgi:hypothetical protein
MFVCGNTAPPRWLNANRVGPESADDESGKDSCECTTSCKGRVHDQRPAAAVFGVTDFQSRPSLAVQSLHRRHSSRHRFVHDRPADAASHSVSVNA